MGVGNQSTGVRPRSFGYTPYEGSYGRFDAKTSVGTDAVRCVRTPPGQWVTDDRDGAGL